MINDNREIILGNSFFFVILQPEVNERKREPNEQNNHFHPDMARLYALYGSCRDIKKARRG
jgi:hypothetical protein